MLQLLIFIVHFMCYMELPIPTSLVDQSLLTQFHMKIKPCFTIGQLYQWRFVTVYYQNFPPYPHKSRRYQINSRGCWPEYWLSHTFKRLKLFHCLIKNVGIKLFIRVRRRKNYVSCYFCKSM